MPPPVRRANSPCMLSCVHLQDFTPTACPPSLPLPSPKPPAERRWAAGPLVAATAVLLGVAAFVVFLVSRHDGAPQEGRDMVSAELPVLDRVEGDTFIVTKSGRMAAASGQQLFPGATLETAGTRGRVVLAYADGSRLEAQSNTLVRQPEVSGETGKRLVVARGTLWARIGPQPKGKPSFDAVTTSSAPDRYLG